MARDPNLTYNHIRQHACNKCLSLPTCRLTFQSRMTCGLRKPADLTCSPVNDVLYYSDVVQVKTRQGVEAMFMFSVVALNNDDGIFFLSSFSTVDGQRLILK